MAGNYTVQQGDFLAKIAKAFGFSDYRTIWNDPQNAQLQALRKNPNVLFPGDILFIPDLGKRVEPRNTDKRHVFKKNGLPLKLRLTLEDLYEKPVAKAPCDLTIDAQTQHLTTDGTGLIEQVIPPDSHDATLLIQDDQTPMGRAQISIEIGDLNPIDEVSGQIGRLNNLGYQAGDSVNPDPDQFESAVEEFQCDAGLTVDGICGPMTQSKLQQVHGC